MELEKLDKMKAADKDIHDIRKQEEVMQESRSMVPDTIRRLKKAYGELEELMQTESDLSGAEEYALAKTALEAAAPIIA